MIMLAVALPSLLTAVTPPPMTSTDIVIPAITAMMMPPPPPTATIVMIIGVADGFHGVCRADRLESASGQRNRSAGCKPQSQHRADTGAKQLFHRDLLGCGREDLICNAGQLGADEGRTLSRRKRSTL
jgi:hypothetical protein